MTRRARELANLMVVPREGAIDSPFPKGSPFGLRPCRAAPAGSIPAGDIEQPARGLANLGVASRQGSIDSLSPESSPFGLRPCRTAPAGSIPAGDVTRRARELANLMVVPREGSIDSLSPESSRLRGLRLCVPLSRAQIGPTRTLLIASVPSLTQKLK